MGREEDRDRRAVGEGVASSQKENCVQVVSSIVPKVVGLWPGLGGVCRCAWVGSTTTAKHRFTTPPGVYGILHLHSRQQVVGQALGGRMPVWGSSA